MPKFREGYCVFPHKRNLYKHAYRDRPTPPPKLCLTCPPPPRHLKIRLIRRSLTFLGHHTLFIREDRLNFTVFFSVTAIYLEAATTPPVKYKIPPRLGSIANNVQQPKYYYHAKLGAFTPKCTIF